MPNIRIDLLKHVRASRVSLLRDRQPDAVDLMIQRADAVAVGPDDFIPQEPQRLVASPVTPMKVITEGASIPTQVLPEIRLRRYKAYSH